MENDDLVRNFSTVRRDYSRRIVPRSTKPMWDLENSSVPKSRRHNFASDVVDRIERQLTRVGRFIDTERPMEAIVGCTRRISRSLSLSLNEDDRVNFHPLYRSEIIIDRLTGRRSSIPDQAVDKRIKQLLDIVIDKIEAYQSFDSDLVPPDCVLLLAGDAGYIHKFRTLGRLGVLRLMMFPYRGTTREMVNETDFSDCFRYLFPEIYRGTFTWRTPANVAVSDLARARRRGGGGRRPGGGGGGHGGSRPGGGGGGGGRRPSGHGGGRRPSGHGGGRANIIGLRNVTHTRNVRQSLNSAGDLSEIISTNINGPSSLLESKTAVSELRQLNEQISSSMGTKDEVNQALDGKEKTDERLKVLRKELGVLRNDPSKVESITKAAGKKCDEEWEGQSKLQGKFRAADTVCQEAFPFAHLQDLKKHQGEKNIYFFKYRDDSREQVKWLWRKTEQPCKTFVLTSYYVRCNTNVRSSVATMERKKKRGDKAKARDVLQAQKEAEEREKVHYKE